MDITNFNYLKEYNHFENTIRLVLKDVIILRYDRLEDTIILKNIIILKI